ncbi:MAG: site-specific integrase [Clostridia bacterium]|nr:site-specific integrase [Clostridia bacterium]
MSEKRKDKKGRVLRNGELQRKDGMYQYDYTDITGKKHTVYSWKLEPTDPLPQGKRKCISLREKIREIQKQIDDDVVPLGGGLTVLELARKYTLQKQGVRESTRSGYNTVLNFLTNDPFGARMIDKIKLSEAKTWFITLQESGKSYGSINLIRGVLHPAFQMAVEDDLIKKNPFGFELATVVVNDSVTRDAITHKQKRKFLEFIKNDEHFSRYYDAIYILFYTGMRISEFCGLTISDINLKKKTVKIERQLQRSSDMRYIIERTKTDSGTRIIPITDDVCECFSRIIKKQKTYNSAPIIPDKNGNPVTGFLYLDKNGMPMVALHWEKYFTHIRTKYNNTFKEQMPLITPHVCRHTYCSHCASAGMNPKHLQYLMGHADISVTLNTYTHVDFDNVEKEVNNLKINDL